MDSKVFEMEITKAGKYSTYNKQENVGQPSGVVPIKNYIIQPAGKLKDFYRIGKLLGSGGFGEVRICVNK